MSGSRLFGLGLVAALALALVFLALPVVAIFTDVPPHRLISALGDGASRDALRLSLETSAIALGLLVLVGTPAAWLLATRSFPGRSVAVTLVELPLVLPPAVAGLGLLAALGPRGIFSAAGNDLVLQTAGVVVAQCFVAAPFYVRGAQAAFAALDPSLLEASRTLGAGEAETWVRIALRVAAPGLLAAGALAWGRALGEFGATLMFAGSLRGVTQTAPLAIYDSFGEDLTGALALAAVLVAASAAILLGAKLATARSRVLARP